jgi:hypothetical protein
LLLTYGTLDDNVHANMTLRVAEELIKANKTFDMFVFPNRNHGYAAEPYVIRRTWDLPGAKPERGDTAGGLPDPAATAVTVGPSDRLTV